MLPKVTGRVNKNTFPKQNIRNEKLGISKKNLFIVRRNYIYVCHFNNVIHSKTQTIQTKGLRDRKTLFSILKTELLSKKNVLVFILTVQDF